MKKWLAERFSQGGRTSDAEEYLLSRGGRRERFESLGVISWESVDGAPEESFNQRYKGGERLRGCICTPYFSLKGEVIGFEARSLYQKWITDYRLPSESKWCTYWLGSDPHALSKLWAGGAVWVVEGLFDMFALDWAVPEKDVILASVTAKLSENHIEFLRRFTGYVHLAFDMDKPGRRGAFKASRSLKEVYVPHRIVSYGPGKDPGEVWDRGGERELRQVFSQVRDF